MADRARSLRRKDELLLEVDRIERGWETVRDVWCDGIDVESFVEVDGEEDASRAISRDDLLEEA